MLGLGTAPAPVFVALCVGLGFWWGLLATIRPTARLRLSAPLPLRAAARGHASTQRAKVGIPDPVMCIVVSPYFRMLTARAITSPRIKSDPAACTAMASLAQRASGITSVGLKAVALVKPRYR